MNIDWKRKLTSRKFWMALAGFVTCLLVFFNVPADTSERVVALLMATANVVAYVIGEGLADTANETHTLVLPDGFEKEEDDDEDRISKN